MRTIDSAILAALEAREGLIARSALWIVARNRTTGDAYPAGFWTGDDDATLAVGAEERPYRGAGALIGIEQIVFGSGVAVRSLRAELNALHPEVQAALAAADPRLARVEIHQVFFAATTRAQLGAPVRVFRGTVDQVPRSVAPPGGQAALTLSLVSSARDLTRALPMVKSDAGHRARWNSDGFRKYADVSGAPVWWGEKRAAPKTSGTPGGSSGSGGLGG